MSQHAVITNYTLSRMHAACLLKDIAKADTPQALRAAAEKRVPYLIGNDREHLRDEYAQRLRMLKGGAS